MVLCPNHHHEATVHAIAEHEQRNWKKHPLNIVNGYVDGLLKIPQVGARVPENLLIEIKVLATRQRRRFNELVEEALNDLLLKHREKSKGKG